MKCLKSKVFYLNSSLLRFQMSFNLTCCIVKLHRKYICNQNYYPLMKAVQRVKRSRKNLVGGPWIVIVMST